MTWGHLAPKNGAIAPRPSPARLGRLDRSRYLAPPPDYHARSNAFASRVSLCACLPPILVMRTSNPLVGIVRPCTFGSRHDGSIRHVSRRLAHLHRADRQPTHLQVSRQLFSPSQPYAARPAKPVAVRGVALPRGRGLTLSAADQDTDHCVWAAWTKVASGWQQRNRVIGKSAVLSLRIRSGF